MRDSVAGGRRRFVARVALGALVLALALAAGCWWFQPARPDEAVVLALSQVDSPPSPEAANTAVPAAAPSSPAASATEAAVDPTCPKPWRALAGKPRVALEQVFQQFRPGALAHAAQLLAASPDAFERVAGRLLAARARDPEGPPDADAYLALVSEALGSNEPRIAALAIQLCDMAPPEHAAACSSISPARWVAVDPDNLQAWLALATDALERSEPRAAREALSRAAQSRSSRSMWSQLLQLPGSPTLQGLSAVERQVLAFDLISVGGLMVNTGTVAVSRMCSVEALTSPARRDECSAIAGLLIDQSETMFEHGVGIGLARRADWPAERIDALEQEHRGLGEAYAAETLFPDDGGDTDVPMTAADACEAFHRAEALLSLVRSGSEMQVARRALQRRQAASSPG